MQWTTSRWPIPAIVGVLAVTLPVSEVSAHTETDYVAVPAGSTVTVTFAPEHGCGDSPTIELRVQAPVEGAFAHEVGGWTSSATPDGAGHTVLRWDGGSTPADEEGAFPVEFTVPDAVGSLLAFPTVQRCDNGEELAWIGTAPGDELPAPQLLVLAAGSAPAATIDEVPAGVPGRDLLAALLGAESGDEAAAPPPPAGATSTTLPAAATVAPGTTAAPSSTAAPTTAATAGTAATPATSAASTTGAPGTAPVTTDASDGGSSTGLVVAVIVIVVAVIGGGTAILLARRRPRPEQP